MQTISAKIQLTLEVFELARYPHIRQPQIGGGKGKSSGFFSYQES